jgi:dethiobiotin synthetase
MIPIHPQGYFITGSDTDVGKTYIACELIRQLRSCGVDLEVRKPAESGCAISDTGELIASDALALKAASAGSQPIERIAAHRFKAALAPPRAAIMEGCNLLIADLLDACSLDDRNHLLIVEGAGGFYSPLAENGLNADLASLLQLAVIIVVKDRIGAVNQALMTIAAVESRQLSVAAVIMNQVEESSEADMNNAEDLRSHCQYPVFRCGYREKLESVFSQ